MRHWKVTGFGLVAAVTVAGLAAGAGLRLPESVDSASPIDLSLKNEIQAAIDRGLDWLVANQKDNGAWSDENYPALTALPLWAFSCADYKNSITAVPKAVGFIKSNIQPDGGLYHPIPGRKGGGLSNYNTAICMTALYSTGDKSLTPVILNARRFIADHQCSGDDVYKGGFGYDKRNNRAYADLLNTYYSVGAMRMTQAAEEMRPKGEKRADIDWKSAEKFITQMQNKTDAGKDQAGGFFYKPGQSKAGTVTNEQGVVVFRSYGSMTYAGMLSLIYAGVDRSDPRVRSAYDWTVHHWSLDENPGMGAQGLYFFYNVLSRALNAYGVDLIKTDQGQYINWRKELARKIIEQQKIDADGRGYWMNDNGRFWERNPVLVTSYSILALEQILGK